MLLEELINPEIKNRKINKFTNIPDNKNVLGSGFFSRVYKDKDPHLVTKSTKTDAYNLETYDVYWYYIRKIVESKINEHNPYFPRVYGVTSYKLKSPTNKIDAKSEMRNAKIEKLESLHSFNRDKELLIPILLRIRNKKYLMKYLNTDENFSDINGLDIMTFITGFVRDDIALRNDDEHIDDKLYLQAIKFIRNISKKAYNVDIHMDNLMIRRTPYGLQLVITDPLV